VKEHFVSARAPEEEACGEIERGEEKYVHPEGDVFF
jgi:hypothetical protein